MDYRKILKKAMIYMEDNLSNPISLEDIADHVNLSLYHFHRIFTSSTGYSLKEYLRKSRLNRAAREIVFNSDKLIEIANRYQFETMESFIRAFRREFQVTPGLMRKEQRVLKTSLFHELEIREYEFKKLGERIMEPKKVELGEMKIIGLKCTTTQKDNTIPQLWCDYMKVCDKILNKTEEDVCVGICLDSNVDMEDFTDETPFDYIAGHLVESFDEVPEGMVTYTVQPSKYLNFTHKGSLDNLSQTYGYIFGEWIKNHDEELTNQDQVEWYDHRFNFGQPESEMDILIPIK